MTPLQAAKAHCANYQPDGSCLGVYYNDDLSIDKVRYNPMSTCVFRSEHPEPCPYFEEIVLPQERSAEGQYYDLMKDFAIQRKSAKRMCLNCHRVALAPKQRYCPKCAIKRIADSKRGYKKQHGHKGEKVASGAIGAESLTKAV